LITVWTGTFPALVSNTSSPVPARRATSTAVAMVACPQNGTSARGLKYRTVYRRRWRSDPVTNAVSE